MQQAQTTTLLGHPDTLREAADVLGWLRVMNLTIDDMMRTITEACRGADGATPTDIVRYVIDQHGIQYEHEDKIRWLTGLAVTSGALEQVRARRYRATGPAPKPRIVLLVSVPPEEYEAVRPYAYQGTPAFIVDG